MFRLRFCFVETPPSRLALEPSCLRRPLSVLGDAFMVLKVKLSRLLPAEWALDGAATLSQKVNSVTPLYNQEMSSGI